MDGIARGTGVLVTLNDKGTNSIENFKGTHIFSFSKSLYQYFIEFISPAVSGIWIHIYATLNHISMKIRN